MNNKIDSYIIFTWINGFLQFMIYRSTFFLLILLSVLFVVIYDSNSKTTVQIRSAVIDSLIPVVKSADFVVNSVVNIKQTISDHFRIYEENQKLRTENELLESYYISFKVIREENNRLKSLLNFTKNNHGNLISSRIIARNNGAYSRSFLIDAGSNAGVSVGQTIMNEQGLVGRVIEINKNNSRVLAITDINSKIPVVALNSREQAIVSGNGTPTLDIAYLKDGNKIQHGEIVMTAGDGEFIPADILVGIVNIDKKQKITIKSFVDSDKLEYVTVISY